MRYLGKRILTIGQGRRQQMPKPPVFYRFIPWLLKRMPNQRASKEKISEIMWGIFGKNRPDGKLTSEGVPRTIHQLLHSVKNIQGYFEILALTKNGFYTIGSDGERVLSGTPPNGLKKISISEIKQWENVCLASTGMNIGELINSTFA